MSHPLIGKQVEVGMIVSPRQDYWLDALATQRLDRNLEEPLDSPCFERHQGLSRDNPAVTHAASTGPIRPPKYFFKK
jgi:hypothetical protein